MSILPVSTLPLPLVEKKLLKVLEAKVENKSGKRHLGKDGDYFKRAFS